MSHNTSTERHHSSLSAAAVMVNGASKAMGLAYYLPKFTVLAMSFFSGFVRPAVSIFFPNAVSQSWFF